MALTETAFTFKNDQNNRLIGIIHSPEECPGRVGLLIVVGGPQYRIGAHRQYVHLARHCAANGIPAMRFDYQGIGDSDGNFPDFEHVTEDIFSAIDEFLNRTPDIDSVAIWGLCEGASGILLGGARHKLASHIILANPWVRSEAGLAKAYVKHYYLDRLKSREFWRKIFSGHLNIKSALSGLLSNIRRAFTSQPDSGETGTTEDIRPFQARMLTGLRDFQGKGLLIMSENDLVAREFDDLSTADKDWQKAIAEKIQTRIDIADTDHTFSTEKWRRAVAEATVNWLRTGQ